MTNLTLKFANPPTDEQTQLLLDNVRAFNQQRTGVKRPRHIAYFFHDEDEQVVGGVQGMLWGRMMHIDVLWVDEKHRGEGLGTNLMAAIEDYGLEHGHPLVYLETASFQALPFYEGLGYRVFAELPEITAGETLYFLRKELNK